MPLHKVTCVPRGHALGVVCVSVVRVGNWLINFDDRHPNYLRTTAFRFLSKNTWLRLTCAWVVGLQKNSVGVN
jgi:hypothetical protein